MKWRESERDIKERVEREREKTGYGQRDAQKNTMRGKQNKQEIERERKCGGKKEEEIERGIMRKGKETYTKN